MWTLGLNLDESWFKTSATSCWCLRTFLIFIIRTIAAWINNFLSSSMCLWVVSCSIFSSVFIGTFILTRNFLLQIIFLIKNEIYTRTDKYDTRMSVIICTLAVTIIYISMKIRHFYVIFLVFDTFGSPVNNFLYSLRKKCFWSTQIFVLISIWGDQTNFMSDGVRSSLYRGCCHTSNQRFFRMSIMLATT